MPTLQLRKKRKEEEEGKEWQNVRNRFQTEIDSAARYSELCSFRWLNITLIKRHWRQYKSRGGIIAHLCILTKQKQYGDSRGWAQFPVD